MFKKALLLFTLVAAVVTVSAFAFRTSQNADLDFVLVNKTGYDIKDVYIAPTNSKDWGDDVMDGEVLKNNTQVKIVFHPKAKAAKWDISVGWVGYDASEEVYWEGFNLTEIEKITLKYNEKTGKTWAETE